MELVTVKAPRSQHRTEFAAPAGIGFGDDSERVLRREFPTATAVTFRIRHDCG